MITKCRICQNDLPEFEKSRGVTVCESCDKAANPDPEARIKELESNIAALLFAIESIRGNLSKNQRQALDNLRAVWSKSK